ncbi:MAG: hypothetical protein AAFP97_05845 [Pseudomonadota bacterium]
MSEKPFVEARELIDLSPGTSIAIWAFRSCAMGMTRCDCLPMIFSDLFGEEGRDVLRHVLVLAQVIGHSGQRKLSLTYPNSQRVTHDEASLLRALNAAQRGRNATVYAQLHWIMAGAEVSPARKALTYVAEKFFNRGLIISDPYAKSRTQSEDEPATLEHRIARFVLKPSR